jgi:integrase
MEGKGRTDLVFTGAKGAVLAVSRFRPRVFAPAVTRAQQADATFPKITPHDLRHYADGRVMRPAGRCCLVTNGFDVSLSA